jgi:cbb3-type cytochrome oxidase subunit 3
MGENQFEGVQIYDVIQDQAFNYWFATDEGLYRYDSYSYTKVDCPDLKGLSLFGFVCSRNNVIYAHNLNNQIIQIRNGVCTVFYELKEDEGSSDISLTLTPSQSLFILGKKAILLTPEGQKTILQGQKSNFYYGAPFVTQKNQIISHVSAFDSLLVFSENQIRIVPLVLGDNQLKYPLNFFRNNGNTYAITTINNEIFRFDEATFSLTKLPKIFNLSTKEYLRFYNQNDYLWLTGSGGGVRTITDPETQHDATLMYPQYMISDVFKDHEGNLLLSTFYHGVLVIPNLAIPDGEQIPAGQNVVSVCQDKEAGILMGTSSGDLLQMKDTQYTTLSHAGTRPLHGIYSWAGFPYIIFDDGKLKTYNKKTKAIGFLSIGSLKDAAIGNERTLYLALNTGVRKITLDDRNQLYTSKDFIVTIRSYAVETEPETENVYIATAAGLKFADSTGKLRTLTRSGKIIFANDLYQYDGIIYASAKSNGILLFRNGEIIRQLNPMINNKPCEVFKLIVMGEHIYANTAQGIVILDMTGRVLLQLNKTFGVSANKIFDFDWIEGKLWISHSLGIQKLDPAQLKHDSGKPLLNLAFVKVNDREVANLNAIESYSSAERKFHFTLSCPTLRNRESIRYHYKLIGYDPDWIVSGFEDNQIVYNALAPGDFTFVAKAENQGVFSDTISYSFYIPAPIYSRWWFTLLAAGIIIAVLYLMFRRQLKVQRRKANMINELNQSRLTAIQSQMNPHFIFNSLNSIQDLVLKGDIDNSYTFITKFSSLIRRTLDYSEKDFIEFAEEIKLLELYLSLEKLRFGDDLHYMLDTASIENILVPPMLIQPFIENALTHGLLHKDGRKEITIRFHHTDKLTCIIEDNGIGRGKSKEIQKRQRADHQSFSVEALNKRFSILKDHHKGESGFFYEDLFEGDIPTGTRVTLFIPIKHPF